MPLNVLTGPLGVKRAAHLLRRTCLGGSKSEIDAFAQMNATEAVEALFNNALPDTGYPVDPLTGEEWITAGNAQSEEFELERYFLSWHIGEMLAHGKAPEIKLSYIFRERLVFFLHTHFTTKRSIVGSSRGLYYQQALFRLFAFDSEDITLPPENPDDPDAVDRVVPRNFRQLAKKICIDNAMLRFLDGRFNVKGSPNENFARELLELYTVGRGLEGNIPDPEFDGDYFTFSEQDVQEGARVLSGFNIDPTFQTIDEETGLPRGIVRGSLTNANQHAEGTKSFSSRLGSGSVIPHPDLLVNGNPTEESVLDEISQFIDLIFDQPQTPVAVCRELYRFFVYHQVSPALQEDIIKEMADVFVANNFKMQPVLEALLTSTHFYEAEVGENDNNFGGLIKSPIDLVLGFIQNFEIELPNYETELDAYYEFTGDLLGAIGNQGMDYYEPFEVAGYAAYHQYPIFNRSWISTNYLTNRYNFIRNAISADPMIEMGQVDIVQYVRDNYSDVASDARNLIISLAQHLLPSSDNLSFDTEGGELTTARLNYFLTAFLFNPQLDPNPEESWSFRWDNGVDQTTVANQLTGLFNAMLQSPEYQLM